MRDLDIKNPDIINVKGDLERIVITLNIEDCKLGDVLNTLCNPS